MRRALFLAEQGPLRDINPHVGCVVLDDSGATIAEGWHLGSGTEHAEINALNKLTPEQRKNATVVVTLEPCNHTGRTGPCAQALIDFGIRRVVYALADPGKESSGGAEKLRQAGIEVIGGVCSDEVHQQIEPWLTSYTQQRPFVTVKWASSLDGRTAADDGSSQWISSPASRQLVHQQREQSDAIVVGTGTVLADNPSLTARDSEGKLREKQPVPVIVGTREIPKESKLFSHPNQPVFFNTHNLPDVLSNAYDLGLRNLYVEGGPTLISQLIQENLVDRFYIFLAPVLLGGSQLALTNLGVETLGMKHDVEIVRLERAEEDIFITARPVRKDNS